jgi:hypothetical protein
MTMRRYLVLLAVMAVAFIFAVIGISNSRGEVRSWISKRYTEQSRDPDGGLVFRSDRKASDVVIAITDRWEPAQRHNDSEGWYLRYSDDLIAVTNVPGGSLIYVDDPETGYGRWFGSVGGRFGTYRGQAESFRGGGPGSGK